jgi:hypothetical protein
MTLAKYAFLADRLFDIPTFYEYKRWHLGPYPPEMKKTVKNEKFFTGNKGDLQVVEPEKLFKYDYPFKNQIEATIQMLASMFSNYPKKDRAHKTELLATVCKVIEDIQSVHIDAVRKSMEDWKIQLKTTALKSKAEKFNREETEECLKTIAEMAWDVKLLNRQRL